MPKLITYFALPLLCAVLISGANATDLRAYQHGIDFVAWSDDGYRLFWSSAPGDPPVGEQHKLLRTGEDCEYFIHDIYSAVVNKHSLQIKPKRVIALPEAQEPVSATRNNSGITLLTFEDGSESDISHWCDGHVEQRYQLFDTNMNPLSELKTVSIAGGHSGHAASSGDLFAIAYAEGWIDGHGVDEAGTGDDIHLDIIDSHGVVQRHRGISVDHGNTRDDWPLVAGSPDTVLLIWQRYVADSRYANLMYAVYRTKDDKVIIGPHLLQTELLYYDYDVQYLPDIQRFVVVGNRMANSSVPFAGRKIEVRSPQLFVYLLDRLGNIESHLDDNMTCGQCEGYHHYTMVREVQPAILAQDDKDKIIYPVKPSGLITLRVTAASIQLGSFYKQVQTWFPLGTDGVFLDPLTAYFVNLTPTGLKPIRVSVIPH